jgi:hypothetical protein
MKPSEMAKILAAMQEQNELLRKRVEQLSAVKETKEVVVKKKDKVKEIENEKEMGRQQGMIEHLWKRCRNMESKDYWWFKQMSRVVTVFGKEMSEKQLNSFMPIWEKYWETKETPKKKGQKANPHS